MSLCTHIVATSDLVPCFSLEFVRETSAIMQQVNFLQVAFVLWAIFYTQWEYTFSKVVLSVLSVLIVAYVIEYYCHLAYC